MPAQARSGWATGRIIALAGGSALLLITLHSQGMFVDEIRIRICPRSSAPMS